MSAALAATDVSRAFRGGAGVHGIDLRVHAGEIRALAGLNGAGKTTLMKLLLGMLRPSSGEVRMDGTLLDRMPASAWSRVGHVIEQPLAYGDLTARENLLLAARLHGVPASVAADIVDAAINAFALERYATVRVRRLSAGNRQRVGLAAAMQHQPRVLVLDEPTSTLDPAGVLILRDALRRLRDVGSAVLVSSHHLDEVARVADGITVVNAGRVVGALDPAGSYLEQAFFALVLADDERRGQA
ncbi:ABC transporter ATP-binding protein [Microbacterium sp. NEAU-LLC]|uniref:ABC transporter ATP-binding protein n=1 Tax=Microbacterium helvum TaxID=2773713 RepID=A0ABR8NKR4_9MICO|nr:ABC transporter ATP-binding protein [Microbacterium helvum]MBD3940513.1 ABC transporter ATP-binding protein [Microbacterium helvum]